ncbi:MAG: dimethylmenaquinone methyltransferase [Hyphomicrobiales bacterium]|nr:dimethylmenaquinone methyltransferase [Hyphomicrobiales bacterium]
MPTLIHAAPATLAAETLDRWTDIPSTIVADVAGGEGMLDPALRPVRSFAGRGTLVGRAVTACCTGTDFGAVLHAADLAGPGDVLVIDAGGRAGVAVIGEIVCGALRRKGARGVVVDGGIRDVGTLAQWTDFAAFARHTVAAGPASFEAGEVNCPVTVGAARIAPGDLIVGDDDGLVAVAPARTEALLIAARRKIELEASWERDLAAGKSMREVFGLPSGRPGDLIRTGS